MHTMKVDISKLKHNIKVLKYLCEDINIVFVSKCLRSDCEFLHLLAPWEFGIKTIADSYINNLAKLDALCAEHGLKRMLLRIEPPQNATEVVRSCEICAASEFKYIKALNNAAKKQNKCQEIMIMCDLGDLREGYFYEEKLYKIIKKCAKLKHIKIRSLGTNLTCLNGILPSVQNISHLVKLAQKAGDILGYKIGISGGNSSSVQMLLENTMPKQVSELRLGDAILCGKNCADHSLIPGCFKDAFSIDSRICECKNKPSMPVGERALDAFGREVQINDAGELKRIILPIGKVSIDESAILFTAKHSELKILGASSDHLIINASAHKELKLGDKITLILEYISILRAYASNDVKLKFIKD